MSASILIIVGSAVLILAYFTYGNIVARILKLDPKRETPAHTKMDGVDYVPAKAPILLGHHFASIAGAAPIIGPITAALFGWVPAILWIIFGGIFFGAVHDFTALFASVRHDGESIGTVIEKNMGTKGKQLFNIFAWLTLVLVVAVFAIVTANTFVSVPSAGTASILFIIIAVIFGLTVYRMNVPFSIATVIGVVALFLAIYLGIKFPLAISFNSWLVFLFIYIFIGSIAPVWILLQPRDFLNSFLLYAILIGGVVGIITANPTVELTSYAGFRTDLGTIFPVLFVTIACGAISGFHSLVASGTTSKQLDKESDAKLVGFGGMLIESLLALIALITAAVITKDKFNSLMGAGGPVTVFSEGLGSFMTTFGLPKNVGVSFTALVVSAFAMTTLDTATRLARFIFQENFESKEGQSGGGNILGNRYVATSITVVAAGVLAFSGQWKSIWPIFGSANQLLAAISLLAVSVWLAKIGRSNKITLYPMYFMFAVTFAALASLILKNLAIQNFILASIGGLLFILAVILAYQAYASLRSVGRQ